jgi:uncharacterized DUF497 family protein
MKFEFDPTKSKANATKHGIDFMAAQELWMDERRLEVPVDWQDEPRWLLVAKAAGKIWTAVFTRRGENIRLISVRRVRDNERTQYEQNQKEDYDGGI